MAVSLLAALGFRVFEDARDGCVDCLPLFQQFGQDLLAIGREPVEALVAFVFFAPLAYQKALGLESAEERIQRAFVDLQAALGKVLAERVAVMLRAKLGQD